MNKPLVSVIMPAYNAEKYISVAIKSILEQSYQNLELLIIDDCSQDNSLNIMNEFRDSRIQIIKNTNNLRISLSKNKAIEQANGKYIISMDADDISKPERVEKLVAFMENNPEVGLCGSYVELINKNSKLLGQRQHPITDTKIRKFIFKFSPYTHGATCIRKSVLERTGYYNPEYELVEDRELYFRIGEVSEFANLSQVLYQLRIHSESITSTKQKVMEKKCARLCWQYLFNKHYPFTISNFLFLTAQTIACYIIPGGIIKRIYYLLRCSPYDHP